MSTHAATASTPSSVADRIRRSHLSESELAELREQLVELEEETERQMSEAKVALEEMRSSGLLTEAATQSSLMTTMHTLHDSERVAIDVADALARMDSGDYGVCLKCQRPIPAGRLQVRPFGRYCVSCS
jgi:RNA polymerase-binding transcription factor DksA